MPFCRESESEFRIKTEFGKLERDGVQLAHLNEQKAGWRSKSRFLPSATSQRLETSSSQGFLPCRRSLAKHLPARRRTTGGIEGRITLVGRDGEAVWILGRLLVTFFATAKENTQQDSNSNSNSNNNNNNNNNIAA